MTVDHLEQVKSEILELGDEALRPIVGKATGDAAATLVDGWTCEPLSAVSNGNGTVGFVKVEGSAITSTGRAPWSSIVKVIDTGLLAAASGRFNDPRREIEVYRSGFFAGERSGMKAAKCYRVDDRPGGAVWLWLQDLSASSANSWQVSDYLQAAGDIGTFNASISLESVAKLEFLDRTGACDRRISALEKDSWAYAVEAAVEEPLVKRAVRGIGASRASQLRDNIVTLVEATRRFPQAVSHNDCHTRNLFILRRPGRAAETRAIDWASIGLMPLGLDAGSLVASGFTWGREEADKIRRIESDIFDIYFRGLQEVGWNQPRQEVRLVYLSSFSTYCLQWVMAVHQLAIDGVMAPHFRRRWGLTPTEAADEGAERLSWMVPLVDEALDLVRGQ